MNNHTPMDSAIFTPLVVFILAVLSLCSTASIPPFVCGAGACNLFGSGDEFCSAGPESRCVPCRDVQHTCFEMAMPFNCTTFCLDRYSTQLKEKFSRELKAKPCEQLSNIPHGFHNQSTVSKPGDVVKSQCQTGYHLVGSSIIKCLPYGQWSDKLPICEETTCTLPAVSHGSFLNKMTHAVYKPGMNVAYICDDGFWAEAAEAVCLSTGTWKSLHCLKEKVIKSDKHENQLFIIFCVISSILAFVVCVLAVFLLRQRKTSLAKPKDEEALIQREEEYRIEKNEQEIELSIQKNSLSNDASVVLDKNIGENTIEFTHEPEVVQNTRTNYVPPECNEDISVATKENESPENNDKKKKQSETDDIKPKTSIGDPQNQGGGSNVHILLFNIHNNIDNKSKQTQATVTNFDPDIKQSDSANNHNGFENCTYARNPTEATADPVVDITETVEETESKELKTDSDGENQCETEVTKAMIQPTGDSDIDKKRHKMALTNNTVEQSDPSDNDRVGIKRKSSDKSDDNKCCGLRGELEESEERMLVQPEDQSRSGMMALNKATLHTADLKRSSDTEMSTGCSKHEDTSDKVKLMPY